MTTTNTEERQEQSEERVSDERILGRLEGRVGLLNENVQAAERRSEERYLALMAEMTRSNRDLSAKIDTVNAKIDTVNTNLSDKIDKTNSDLTTKIDTVNTNLSDKIDKTSSELTAKIDTVNTNLSDKIDKTGSELNGRFIILLVGVIVAIVGGYIGMAVALAQIAATR